MNKRPPDSDIKFIADHMLGKLAKWLRILGYDTAFSPGYSDPDIARIALREDRVVLTRDHGLVARKAVKKYIFIKSQDYAAQIQQVFRELGLRAEIDRVFSFCPVCNKPVREIEKGRVAGAVPPYVFKTNELFSECPDCHRIFWQGTHYDHAVRKLKEIFHEGPGGDSV